MSKWVECDCGGYGHEDCCPNLRSDGTVIRAEDVALAAAEWRDRYDSDGSEIGEVLDEILAGHLPPKGNDDECPNMDLSF